MSHLIESFSLAMLNSVGQGLFIYLGLVLALRMLPARDARVRYHLSLAALLSIAGFFIVDLWHLLGAAGNSLSAGTPTIIWLPGSTAPAQGVSGMAASGLVVLAPWIGGFYALGLVVMLVRALGGVVELRRMKSVGVHEAPEEVALMLVKLCERAGISKSVRALMSVKAKVPMVVGVLKPVLLLPVTIVSELDTQQLEAILLHELLHVKRQDYLVNMVQIVLETVLFFNPFVWLVSAVVRREREYACDDSVLSLTNLPLSYALALTKLAGGDVAHTRVSVAATGNGKLMSRIVRIMEGQSEPRSYARLASACVALLSMAFLTAWIRPGTPDGKGTANKASTEKEGVARKNVTVTTLNNLPEESTLVQRLMADRVVDQVKGFLVEKQNDELYVNGHKLESSMAGKYLNGLKQQFIRVQVFSLDERMKMHPDVDFIQLLLPCTFSSPCVRTQPKEGC